MPDPPNDDHRSTWTAPDWILPAVASMARVLSGLGEDKPEQVERLVTSPDMKPTWQYLAQAKVKASAIEALPKNLTLAHWGVSEIGVLLQERACAAFLACVMLALVDYGPALTRLDVEMRTKPRLAAAEQGRRDGKNLRFFLPETDLATLRRAAEIWTGVVEQIERNAAKLPYDLPQRARDLGTQRAQAQAISKGTKALFGSPQYGVVANALSVALGKRISKETVRAWCAP